MFDIYIKNYKSGSSFITTETLLYSIPHEYDEENLLTDPKVTGEMGKAGSFEFSMNPGHPYYDSLCQMKTLFRIVYDGDTIFRGRVLTIDAGHFTGVKNVHCEGDLAFFLDSQMEGIADDKRSKTTALAYFQSILSTHNSQMSEGGMTDKQFVLGEVPGNYSNSIEVAQKLNPDSDYRYGSGSWRDSQSALNELTNGFGGYIRTRYQNGSVYVDWLDNYFRPAINPQTIEVYENLIDINSNSEVNNIFTALIPVGSKDGQPLYIDGYQTAIHGNNRRILVPQITQVFTDEQLNQGFHRKEDYVNAINDHGIVYKTESFSNADTKEKLWNYATDWIKNNYCGKIDSFTISAIDMHLVGESSGKFLVGDRVRVIFPDIDNRMTDPTAMIDKTMTVMKITYDLCHPEKNQYEIGIPNAILKKDYGTKKKKSASKGMGSSALNDSAEDIIEEAQKSYDEYLIWTFVQDGAKNSDKYQKYKEEHGEQASDAILYTAYMVVDQAMNSPDPNQRKRAASIILDGEENKIKMMGSKFRSPEIDEYNDALQSIILNGDENVISIKESLADLPEGATWDLDSIPDVITIAAENASGSISFNQVVEQTTSSVGTNFISTLIDGFTGAFTGNKIDLAATVQDVGKVLSNIKIPNISLEGLWSRITGGNGENNTFSLYGKGGTIGEAAGLLLGKIKDIGQGAKETVTTAAANGESGLFSFIGGLFGGNTDVGVTGLESGTTPATVAIDGETGTEQVGKDQYGNWRVLLNDSVTYTDRDGVVHTLEPGFVTANDFASAGANPIPSFSTKVAVIDTLIADTANIGQLWAAKANIDKLIADSIVGGTVVRSDYISGNNITSPSGTISGNIIVASRFGFYDSEGARTYIVPRDVTIGGTRQSGQVIGTTSNDLEIPDAITSITLGGPTNNQYTLYKTTFSNSTPVAIGSFSRATQLRGDWSGLNYTVTADPQAASDPTHAILTANLALQTPTGTSASCNVNLVQFTNPEDPTQITQRGSRALYVKADDDYCYITNADATPSASNILAQITNPKQGGATVISASGWNYDGTFKKLVNVVSGTGVSPVNVFPPSCYVNNSGSWENPSTGVYRIAVAPYGYDEDGNPHIMAPSSYIYANDVYTAGYNAAPTGINSNAVTAYGSSFNPSDYEDWSVPVLGTISLGGYYLVRAVARNGSVAYAKFAVPNGAAQYVGLQGSTSSNVILQGNSTTMPVVDSSIIKKIGSVDFRFTAKLSNGKTVYRDMTLRTPKVFHVVNHGTYCTVGYNNVTSGYSSTEDIRYD